MISKKKKWIFGSLAAFLVVIIGGGVFAYNYFNKLNYVKLEGTREELKVSEETSVKSKSRNIENILLLGVDKQENASDTNMILSIDYDKNTVKLISLLRDMYVDQGEGMANKINYAYHYGGVEGSVKTVNELFNLDITKYAKVTFEELIAVVDIIGGIDLKISEKEMAVINNTTVISPDLKKSGMVHLNGEQALAFSRIRKIDSDANRSERQREVMMAMLVKGKSMGATELPGVAREVSSTIETNMSFFELMDIGTLVLGLDMNNLDELRLPLDGTTSHFTSGVYHLNWDKEVNTKALHEFIYGVE